MRIQLWLLIAALFVMASCDKRSSVNLEVNMDGVDVGELQISSETMNDIIQNIASPVEVAARLKELDIPYSEEYLADPELLSATTTPYEMAFSLGVLSADLGYLNIYEQSGTAVDLLSGMNRLADALQLGLLFDFEIFTRLATTNPDTDSLLFISVNSFNKMVDYLRDTDHSGQSALLITGVWLEGLYQATQVAGQNSSEDLKSMIGEQKLILNDLLLILNSYRNEEEVVPYISSLETIRTAYNGVKISYQVGEPQALEDDGMLMVVQSESSHVTLSEETLRDIIEVTRQIRNIHTNNNA